MEAFRTDNGRMIAISKDSRKTPIIGILEKDGQLTPRRQKLQCYLAYLTLVD
jgi:hypothetical protein